MQRFSVSVALLLAACAPSTAKTEGVDDGSEGSSVGVDDGADGTVDGADGADGDDIPDSERDDDGDGVVAADDCDDDDPSSFPGADESFDGADNDCDGWVDEVEVCATPEATIQETADAAPDGATVLICAGVWPEQLVLDGRVLLLAGEEGAEATTVTGEGAGTPLSVSGGDIGVVGLTLADGVGDLGGALSCQAATLSVSESVLSGSSAETGGGLGAANCELAISDTAVSGNVAVGQGGGIFTNRSNGTLERVTVEGNVADEGGGAFLFEGTIDVTDADFLANEALTVAEDAWGPGGGGGGLWSGAHGTVEGSRFVGNHSGYHAGGAYFYRGDPEVRGNTFDANTCGEDGAGVYFNYSTAQIIGNTITNNVAADDAGGLRHYIGSSRIEGNTIIGNSAGDDGGGAKMSHSEHEFFDNVLEDNVAGDAGGGLELDNDSSHVSGCTFRGNQAYRGAGLHNWRTETTFTIESSTFIGNTATDCGGGLSFDNSPHRITVRDLWIEGNAANDGAGLCTDRIYRSPADVGGVEGYFQDTILAISNVGFTGNVAGDDGGAVYVRAGQVTLVNVTMADNAGPGASAMAVKGSAVGLSNSILSENVDGAALLVEDTEDGAGSIAVSYSDLWGNDGVATGMDDPTGAAGNISGDPRLGSSLELLSGSAAIDAGDPAIDDTDGSRSDMGMYGGPGAP
jgi:hypothetical protein